MSSGDLGRQQAVPRGARIDPLGQQQSGQAGMPFPGSHMEQLRLAAGASASQAGAVPQQQAGNFRIAAPGGHLQRRQDFAFSIAGRQIGIGALLQKQPGDLLMLVFHGKVKRC